MSQPYSDRSTSPTSSASLKGCQIGGAYLQELGRQSGGSALRCVRQALFKGAAQRFSREMTSESAIDPLVGPEWLQQRLGDSSIKVLDASWYMPFHRRNPVNEFCTRRIPGARFFDLDEIADTSTDLPHMLPSEQAFAAAMDALEITDDSAVVVYDGLGIFSAPRAWWTFKVFGHDKVAVLNGGLPAWEAAGFSVDAAAISQDDASAPAKAAHSTAMAPSYTAQLQRNMVRTWQEMLANIDSKQHVVVDARLNGRFMGRDPEPRQGCPSGHIPGSLNVPFTEMIQDGRFRDAQSLRAAFEAAGVDLRSSVTCSCGSGVTASILAHALYQLDCSRNISIYDGSWTEWAERPDTPKACLGQV